MLPRAGLWKTLLGRVRTMQREARCPPRNVAQDGTRRQEKRRGPISHLSEAKRVRDECVPMRVGPPFRRRKADYSDFSASWVSDQAQV